MSSSCRSRRLRCPGSLRWRPRWRSGPPMRRDIISRSSSASRKSSRATFLMRAFHHGAVKYNVKSGIAAPKDLEGRKVGVNRGYTVTTGLWARSVLQHQYGVDLDKITWVLSGDEHVAEYRPPANVIPIEKGRKMSDLLASGELSAAIGVEIDHPDVKLLIKNARETGVAALRRRGLYPINHTVVIRNELI